MCNKVVVFYSFKDIRFFDQTEVPWYRKTLFEINVFRVPSKIQGVMPNISIYIYTYMCSINHTTKNPASFGTSRLSFRIMDYSYSSSYFVRRLSIKIQDGLRILACTVNFWDTGIKDWIILIRNIFAYFESKK